MARRTASASAPDTKASPTLTVLTAGETKPRNTYRAPKQAANGEGSVYQRKSDGRWVANVTANGRRRVFYARDQREARRKLREALSLIEQNRIDECPAGMTVERYLVEHWLPEVAAVRVRESTLIRYEQLVRYQIVPYIGDTKLTRLTSRDVTRLYKALITGEPPRRQDPEVEDRRHADAVSPRTVLHVHRLLHTALRTAVAWKWVVENVVDVTDAPRVEDYEHRALTPEEARSFIAAAYGDEMEVLWFLGIASGMRVGELLALKHHDYIPETATLQVRRTLTRTRKGMAIGNPKAKASRRGIYLSPPVAASLDAHLAWQAEQRALYGEEWNAEGWLICDERGHRIERTHMLRRHYWPLLARAGLPRIRPHDLRHSCATLMAGLDIHMATIARTLGHGSTEETSRTYVHAQVGPQRRALAELGQSLWPGHESGPQAPQSPPPARA